MLWEIDPFHSLVEFSVQHPQGLDRQRSFHGCAWQD